ncbi:MAG: hypothetical protein JWQ20_26 [Conexibacter sp.]|nr:hypothetical protein [Conexibacter sp.]
MPAYILVDVDVHDPERYQDYRRAPSTAGDHGGRFVVRGGAAEVLEGDCTPNRIAVLEFPDMASARAWYSSEAYQAKAKIRHEAAVSTMILVEGLE